MTTFMLGLEIVLVSRQRHAHHIITKNLHVVSVRRRPQRLQIQYPYRVENQFHFHIIRLIYIFCFCYTPLFHVKPRQKNTPIEERLQVHDVVIVVRYKAIPASHCFILAILCIIEFDEWQSVLPQVPSLKLLSFFSRHLSCAGRNSIQIDRDLSTERKETTTARQIMLVADLKGYLTISSQSLNLPRISDNIFT